MGRYIRRARLDGPWFLSFADSSPRPGLEAPLVFRYGRAVGDAGMVALAAEAAREGALCSSAVRGRFGHLGRSLPALFALRELCAAEPAASFERDVWLPDLEVMIARETVVPGRGFVVAAKGGHNAESHNHNDVGNVILLHDGEPVLVDAGVGVYTKKTFSAERYSLWTMRSTYHNLPSFGGFEQRPGRAFEARDVQHVADDLRAELRLDMAGAYPEDAGLERLERTVTLDRSIGEVRLEDRWSRPAPGDGPARWHLLTSRRVERVGDTRLRLLAEAASDRSSPPLVLDFEPADLTVELEPLPIEDAKLARSWSHGLTRIVLTLEEPAHEGTWKARLRPTER